MTADQKEAIASVLAIGTVLSDIARQTGTSWAAEKAHRWQLAVDRWQDVASQIQCRGNDCDREADSGGKMCAECWIDSGPWYELIGASHETQPLKSSAASEKDASVKAVRRGRKAKA